MTQTFYDIHEFLTVEFYMVYLEGMLELLSTVPEPQPCAKRVKVTITVEEIKDEDATSKQSAL